MTAHKHFKNRVRARMTKTGESYATARCHIIREAPPPPADPATRWHFPGNVPAATALPDDVPALKEAKERHAHKAELQHAGCAAGTEDACANGMGELGDCARGKFPLTDAECADLRAGLQRRIQSLYEGEVAAAAALAEALQSL